MSTYPGHFVTRPISCISPLIIPFVEGMVPTDRQVYMAETALAYRRYVAVNHPDQYAECMANSADMVRAVVLIHHHRRPYCNMVPGPAWQVDPASADLQINTIDIISEAHQ